ncbi:hypothetical protein TRL7639_02055 [Falsiruegeria litorea R37]|uniref:DUF3887 domain-containing protein n=1 Tax=Falsiruegeria litorea R37 TaxID=1200284 RepID=A0A1Y5SG84_9RHOB|nr:hypothetical protein [Falsiruegeria litorea]SLN39995.1 hypothetical protein TRL7639_02055 [Falsiruegeria litorea R37]
MKRISFVLALLLCPVFAWAEDSRFDSYDAYVRFIDDKIMSRDFIPLISNMGGKDEYTPEQMRGVNGQLLNAMPFDFTGTALIKKVDLGNGFSQEMRTYWNDRTSYVYFYAFLHQTDDDLIVLKFNLNTNSEKIFSKF